MDKVKEQESSKSASKERSKQRKRRDYSPRINKGEDLRSRETHNNSNNSSTVLMRSAAFKKLVDKNRDSELGPPEKKYRRDENFPKYPSAD